ncbi:short-chain dehydrogenase/reductase [Neohortaea acidophila]|uniref:Short-chain dehydrogenase/reductase n=1 Tax=Neohortaea acidophila TaxID=245834 RepID=A0A6A6PS08_9PEZI|nr:short-chain dehydrogenase/reductase [Neohortaea acidophila]KAF2482889.1 short-chain dehydrogenase/reductase [Neohortaea acidophila]
MAFVYSQLFVTPRIPPAASLTGQTAIITGSNVGLGKEAARHLTALGCTKVILAVRNTTAGEDARKDILASTGVPPHTLEVWSLDLADYGSVKRFAKRAESELQRIDILLENAGIATDKFALSEGHERTVTVNVVSTFLLAFLLLPKLKETAKKFAVKPRLSIVSSEVHAWTKFAEWKQPSIFPALDDEATANMQERYMTSKLLEVLAIRQFAPKLAGTGVILNYLNPGLCHSELGRDAGWSLYLLKMALARSTEVGSRTLVCAAVAGEESQGKYMHDGKVDESALSPFVRSQDGEEAGRKVWGELKGILEGVQKGVTEGF